jgi:thioredoxin 2
MDEKNYVIIQCTACGAKNRIPVNRMKEHPRCGRCHAPLNLSPAPENVTDKTFRHAVIASPVPVLLDCWAPWCGPCRTVGPILEDLARDYSGRVKIAKLNVDENPETAARFSIRSIPTMLLFKGGREVNRLIGALPRAQIEQALKSLGI